MEKNIQRSVVESLDGADEGLFPYLPYILQDLLEIGANPEIILSLIKENIIQDHLRILDLACGKGAVSVHLAKNLNCFVKGIDALPEFIASAKEYASQNHVEKKCEFETGDIRKAYAKNKNYNVVVFGAVGKVLGNLFETLSKLKETILTDGYVVLDDSYIDDHISTSYNRCLRKSEFYTQIKKAGFEIIKEIVFEKNQIKESDNYIYKSIHHRVNELINKIPGKKELFLGYLNNQEIENAMLENVLTSGTWLLKICSNNSS